MKIIQRNDLLFPELSYQIIGVLFDVSNTLGFGYHEKYYQKAIAALLSKLGIRFKEQVIVEMVIDGTPIAKGIADFIIDEKIILEIKQGDRFLKQNISQLHSYLKMSGLQLGILANFTSNGLIYKRIVNIRNS